jgi:hypothetical protein
VAYGVLNCATSPTDHAMVDPGSYRFWVRNDSVLTTTCGSLLRSTTQFVWSCPRPCGSEQASGMIIDGSGQEGLLRGRPAHDHWMNSTSSGQHTAHYSPVIIATFVDQFIALARWRPCAFFLDGSGAAVPTRNPPLMSLRAPGRNEGLIGQLVTLGAPPSIIRAAAKPHRW